ncbi:hypothetical protein CJ255_20450 [Candidatus Viridilinea mediisalina]|uniref:Uncharacterized protein n=1 Tax=Candidatus Viridilinea mediisalina TaxID=2024553 RepID=A0A2A6RE31_9CHLR|nr:hypothetical protein CJ255_20450 [Candidatus Viridilinea mediisalina]
MTSCGSFARSEQQALDALGDKKGEEVEAEAAKGSERRLMATGEQPAQRQRKGAGKDHPDQGAHRGIVAYPTGQIEIVERPGQTKGQGSEHNGKGAKIEFVEHGATF